MRHFRIQLPSDQERVEISPKKKFKSFSLSVSLFGHQENYNALSFPFFFLWKAFSLSWFCSESLFVSQMGLKSRGTWKTLRLLSALQRVPSRYWPIKISLLVVTSNNKKTRASWNWRQRFNIETAVNHWTWAYPSI